MKSRQIVFLVVVLILILGFGYLSFHFYSQSKKNADQVSKVKNDLDLVGKDLNNVKTAYSEKERIVDITKLAGKNLTLTYLSRCEVALAIPDSTKTFEPLDSSPRTWRLSSEVIAKEPAYSDDPFVGGYGYYALLKSDLDASGYVPGLVYVKCAENKAGYTSETLAKKYIDVIKAGNTKVAAELGETTSGIVVKDNGVLPKWGIDTRSTTIMKFSATDSNVENGAIFVHGNKIFYVYKVSASSVKKTLNSMNGIFDSLVFLSK